MSTYKITNITNLAGKRDMKFNSELDIDYVDSMIKKTIKIKPGETIYLQISSLPLSVHRLRVKRLISVVEIAENELKRTMDAAKPQTTVKKSIEQNEIKTNQPIIKKKAEVKTEVKKVHEVSKKQHDEENTSI